MLYTQPPLITDDDLSRELATARRRVTSLLQEVGDFTVIAHHRPWVYLDDVLSELRAAATTVATLEQLQAVR